MSTSGNHPFTAATNRLAYAQAFTRTSLPGHDGTMTTGRWRRTPLLRRGRWAGRHAVGH